MHTASHTSAAVDHFDAWRQLDIPGRMAVVIERFRFMLDETVSLKHFASQPETCDLSDGELHAHIGKALQLVENASVPEPTYDREARIRQGVKALIGILPSRDDIDGRLALHDFSPAERRDLLAEIVTITADEFAALQANPDVTDRYPEMRDALTANAN